MKRPGYALSLFAICCGLVFAEDEETQQRRRPRIRVYDESPRLIPVTRESESSQASRQEMDRRIRQDRPLSSGLQAPGGNFSPIPSLVAPQWVPPQEASSDDQESSWIDPLEFLSEEDLYEAEGLEDESLSDEPEPEIEITAWEDLQKEMFKQTLSTQSENELTMEELEELTSGSNEDSDQEPQTRGLDLEPVAPLESPESFNESSTSRAESRERTDVSLFTPILRMETRGAELSAVADPERGEPVEFSGSRALFNQIKQNQELAGSVNLPEGQPNQTFARPQFEPLERPSPSTRGFPAALPGAGFGNANVSRNPGPLPGAVGNARTPSATFPESPGPSQRDPERFRPSENRIRSQLGPASGGRGF